MQPILEQDLAFFLEPAFAGARRARKAMRQFRIDTSRRCPQAQAVPAVRRELERDELIIQVEHPGNVQPRACASAGKASRPE